MITPFGPGKTADPNIKLHVRDDPKFVGFSDEHKGNSLRVWTTFDLFCEYSIVWTVFCFQETYSSVVHEMFVSRNSSVVHDVSKGTCNVMCNVKCNALCYITCSLTRVWTQPYTTRAKKVERDFPCGFLHTVSPRFAKVTFHYVCKSFLYSYFSSEVK